MKLFGLFLKDFPKIMILQQNQIVHYDFYIYRFLIFDTQKVSFFNRHIGDAF